MWSFGTVASSAFFTILVIAPGRAAENAAAAQCTVVRFPDVFGFQRCMANTVNLCNISETKLKEATHNLARCFARSGATPAIAYMFMNGMREAILMALQLASPNAAQFLYPLLKLIQESIRQESLQERLLPQRFCDRKIAVNFTKVPHVAECALPIELLCPRMHQLSNGQISTLLLGTMVCIFKKFPQFNIHSLIKEVICMILDLIVGALQRRQHLYTTGVPFEIAQLLLKCNVYEVVSPKAERRLLDELSE